MRNHTTTRTEEKIKNFEDSRLTNEFLKWTTLLIAPSPRKKSSATLFQTSCIPPPLIMYPCSRHHVSLSTSCPTRFPVDKHTSCAQWMDKLPPLSPHFPPLSLRGHVTRTLSRRAGAGGWENNYGPGHCHANIELPSVMHGHASRSQLIKLAFVAVLLFKLVTWCGHSHCWLLIYNMLSIHSPFALIGNDALWMLGLLQWIFNWKIFINFMIFFPPLYLFKD